MTGGKYYEAECANCEDKYTSCQHGDDAKLDAAKELIDEGWKFLSFPKDEENDSILWLCPPCSENVQEAGESA